ncbi:nuclear transport factor 2 family protein [Jannaschia sp. R86511]|uniref:nuclear transport factor 2 family protein n=1 Tax=Jannaschia sp. R86511 TaxID=3093853 RepID=UPI0036D3F5B4
MTDRLPAAVAALRDAINSASASAVAACFADDYEATLPMHPSRDFTGSEQVEKNWTVIFSQLTAVHAEVLRHAVHDDEVWSEWEITGTSPGGSPALLRGPVIWTESDGRVATARFYLDPVTERPAGDSTRD